MRASFALRAFIGLTCLILVLSGCTGRPAPQDFAGTTPEIAIERFFDGHLVSHGVFQDRFGAVREVFTADLDGRWDGRVLTLDERFAYDDGTSMRRTWHFVKAADHRWVGTAEGIVGQAVGVESGRAFNLVYTQDLRRGGLVRRVDVDDWFWLMDDRTIVNRGYVSKFGVDIGTVVVSFRRDAPLPR